MKLLNFFKKRPAVCVLVVVVVLLFVFLPDRPSGDSAESNDRSDPSVLSVGAESASDFPDDVDPDDASPGQSTIDTFLSAFNDVSGLSLSDVSEIDISDKDGGHYRTEFRLPAFNDSYAITGYIDGAVVDVISYGSQNGNLRIYSDNISFDLAKKIVEAAAPLLDDSLSADDVQKILLYLDEHGEANGYYYNNIGVLLLKNYGGSGDGYDLMLEAE